VEIKYDIGTKSAQSKAQQSKVTLIEHPWVHPLDPIQPSPELPTTILPLRVCVDVCCRSPHFTSLAVADQRLVEWEDQREYLALGPRPE
jgi:hypothetical protein